MLALLLLVGLLAVVVSWRQRPGDSPAVPRQAVAATMDSDSMRPGLRWYVGEGYLSSTALPLGARPDEVPAAQSSRLHVLNPGPVPALVRVSVHRVTQGAGSFGLQVAPGRLITVDLATRREIPTDEAFWIALEADQPVFPQLVQSNHRLWDPVPDTLEMVMPQPGPADATFTEWVYPDGFQGGTATWIETETISLLNPGTATGLARLTFQFRDRRRPRSHAVTVPAGRVTIIDLARLFAAGDPVSPPVVSGDYVTRVEATVPVVSQQTRRASWRGSRFVLGSKTGTPIRLAESQRAREWFYGGGWIRDLGVLPRGPQDHTWQLLFTVGLDAEATGLDIRTYRHTGAMASYQLDLPPGRSDLQWLHETPWRERLGVGAPWGLRLSSQGAMAAAISTAEYGPWSQGIPEAMSSAPLVPGPLASEWWLGVSRHSGADDQPVEWTAAWQFLNPGTSPVEVTLRLHGLGGEPERRRVTVGPGSIVRVSGDDVVPAAGDQPVVVSADGDGAFLAHAWLRATARGVPVTRALASSAGVPISLRFLGSRR